MEVSSAAPSATTTPAPDLSLPATPTTSAPSATPASFDWKTQGLDDAGMGIITERQWKNPADLLKSYVNLEKLATLPPDRLAKIPKDNDAAAWSELYGKLGRPETADKYVIPVPDGDKGEFAGVAKGWFHESGISQAQATKLSEKWNGYMAEQQKAVTTQQDQANQMSVNELKQAWGADYDKRAMLVDRAAEQFGMTQEHLAALKSTLGPKGAMTFLYNIGAKIAVEDTNVPGITGPSHGFTMTPEQAKATIAQRRTNKDFAALFTSADPKQRLEAREEMDRLHKLAYPGATDYAPGSVART